MVNLDGLRKVIIRDLCTDKYEINFQKKTFEIWKQSAFTIEQKNNESQLKPLISFCDSLICETIAILL